MNFQQIVALDLEQCCWGDDRSPGEIIQIGLAVFDLVSGKTIKTRSDFVLPRQDEISQYCTNLTGITLNKLKKAGKPLEVVLDSIYQKIGGQSKIYITWGNDMANIEKYCHLWNIPFKFQNSINLSLLFHMHLQQENPQRYSLEKALKSMGLQFEGKAHDAMIDAQNTAILAYNFFKKTGLIQESKVNHFTKASIF